MKENDFRKRFLTLSLCFATLSNAQFALAKNDYSQEKALVKDGMAKYKNEQYDAALTCFDSALRLCEHWSPAYYGRGLVYLATKKEDKAQFEFWRVICCNGSADGDFRPPKNMLMDSKDKWEKLSSTQLPSHFIHKDKWEKLSRTQLPSHYTHTEKPSSNQPFVRKTEDYAWLTKGEPPTKAELKNIQARNLQREATSNNVSPAQVEAITVYNNAAKCLHDGNFQSAIALFSQAIQLSPSLAAAYIGRGTAYGKLKQYDVAINELSTGIAAESASKTGASKKTLNLGYSNRALCYRGTQQYDKAISDCNIALSLDPLDGSVFVTRGIVYEDQKQHDQAISDFERAIALNPQNAVALAAKAVSYQHLNQYDRAISDADRALAIDPSLAGAYECRGTAYIELHQTERGIIDMTKSIELDPQPLIYAQRGAAYFTLKQYDRALSDFDQAITLKTPDPAGVLCFRGACFSKLKRDDRAVEDYTHVLELKEYIDLALWNRASAYNALKDYDKAIADCNQAIDVCPSSANAYNVRCCSYYFLHDYNKAMPDANKAIALDANLADAYASRALIFAKQNRASDSAKDLAKATQLDPNNDWLKFVKAEIPPEKKLVAKPIEKSQKSTNIENFYEHLNELERQKLKKTYSQEAITERLARLELKTFGSQQSGSPQRRLDSLLLNTETVPSASAQSSQVASGGSNDPNVDLKPLSTFCKSIQSRIKQTWSPISHLKDNATVIFTVDTNGKVGQIEAQNAVSESSEMIARIRSLKDFGKPPASTSTPIWFKADLSNKPDEISVCVKDWPSDNWLANFTRRMKIYWHPRKDGVAKIAVAKLKINNAGALLEAHIEKSSGDNAYDAAALKSLGEVLPMPLPDGAPEAINIEFTFTAVHAI